MKTIAVLLAGSAATLGAQQQALVGWDFSQFSQDGFSSIDGETLTGAVDANYSTNANNPTAFEAAFGNGLGTLYYDGTNGSSALSLDPSDVEPNGGNDAGTFGFSSLGASGEIAVLETQGQEFATARALGFNSGANGESFTFEVDLSSFDEFSSAMDWSFAFVGYNASDSDNASSITWEWSTDGSTFNSGTTTDLTQNLTRFDLDVSALSDGELDGEDGFFLRGTINGVTDGLTFIDNVGVSASPEASGALFILQHPDSERLVDDWYATPMGELYTAAAPWLWSNNYGWTFSRPENTGTDAFVYIQSAPFESWVFVDQDSASSEGFWGYAFSAETAALNGWFFFFNEASTESDTEFFVWDNEGSELLTFEDK